LASVTISLISKILFIALILPFLSPGQSFEWARRAGGQGDNRANSIRTDQTGSSYITGRFSGTTYFDDSLLVSSGDQDMFLAKYQSDGRLAWIRRAGGKYSTSGEDIAIDRLHGFIFVTGFYYDTTNFGKVSIVGSPFYLAKYDTSGDLIWVRTIQTTGGGSATKLSVDRDGNVFVCGEGSGAITFDSLVNSNNGFFLAKFDSTGKFVWVKFPVGTAYLECQGVSIDSFGSIYVTGDFQNGTVTFGTATLICAGSVDVFTVKYDRSGEVIWARRAGGSSDDYPGGICLDELNNVYIVGVFGGSFTFGSDSLVNVGGHDIFLAKYDSSGNVLWVRQIGGRGSDEAGGEVGDITCSLNHGEVEIIGICSDSCRFDSSIILPKGTFLAGYDLDGRIRWVQQAIGVNPTSNTYGTSLDVDSIGNSYITGFFDGTSAFGSLVLSASGIFDIFVAKISNTSLSVGPHWNSITGGFHLFQNFPNPFNPLTVIQYQVPTYGKVILKIYNILGQEVGALVDNFQEAGYKSVTFNAKDLPSGLYFYRLQTGNFTDTKKLILLK
jgi:hypothetical protein